MPFTSRTPTYLTPEQRHALTQIPSDLSDREIARHYTGFAHGWNRKLE